MNPISNVTVTTTFVNNDGTRSEETKPIGTNTRIVGYEATSGSHTFQSLTQVVGMDQGGTPVIPLPSQHHTKPWTESVPESLKTPMTIQGKGAGITTVVTNGGREIKDYTSNTPIPSITFATVSGSATLSIGGGRAKSTSGNANINIGGGGANSTTDQTISNNVTDARSSFKDCTFTEEVTTGERSSYSDCTFNKEVTTGERSSYSDCTFKKHVVMGARSSYRDCTFENGYTAGERTSIM